ncbi:MAG: hypothetical protein ABIG46_02045 [Candidatus Omnitrophota bacterium]
MPKIKIKKVLILRVLIVCLLVCPVFVFLLFVVSAFKKTDYFKIKDILSKEADSSSLGHLKGQNIFAVNLSIETKTFLERNPQFRNARIIRILPNQIYLDSVLRQPLAYVRLSKDYYIDREMFIFPALDYPVSLELPMVTGLEKKLFVHKGIRGYNIRELKLSLELIQEIKQNKALHTLTLKRLDAGDPNSLLVFASLNIAEDNLQARARGIPVEVRFSTDKIKEKVGILASVLTQGVKDFANIKYIDLRFKEPVIKFKNAD